MTAELLWLLLAVDPTVGDPTTSPMFRKAPKLAVTKSRHNPRGDGQVTHNWLLKQYRHKLARSSLIDQATNRSRMTTQTTMTVKVGFEVRCFLRLRSRRDVDFRLASHDATSYATGLVPDRR